jgi:hypothetical protein
MAEILNYSTGRFRKQRNWHNSKATWNKRWFYFLEITTLGAGATIPVVILWAADNAFWARLLPALLGGLVVITTGLSKLFKFQENWLQYRTLVEDLDREEVLYKSGIGNYSGLDATAREALFPERVENALARVTAQYVAAHRAAREAAPNKSSDASIQTLLTNE